MSYARSQAILAFMYAVAAGLNLAAAIIDHSTGFTVAAFIWALALGVQASVALDARLEL